MSDAYSQFNVLKQKQLDLKKEERAAVTIQYYDSIGEMISSGMYANNETFLYSVQQFIEEKEYVTDRQIEVIDRIRADCEYHDQPF